MDALSEFIRSTSVNVIFKKNYFLKLFLGLASKKNFLKFF